MVNATRLLDKQTGKFYIVDEQNNVYTDVDGDGKISKKEKVGEGQAPVRELIEAKRYLDTYFHAPVPGTATEDGRFHGRGRLNAQERDVFERSETGVQRSRTALQRHLDFFDFAPADGRIDPDEMRTGFRGVGLAQETGPASKMKSWLRAVTKALGSIAFFGNYRHGDFRHPFSVDIEKIGSKRPQKSTGIYDKDGEVDQAKLDKLLGEFDKVAVHGKITFEQLQEITNKTGIGMLPRAQFKTLMQAVERVNDGKFIGRDQLEALYDSSLLYQLASFPNPDGKRPLRKMLELAEKKGVDAF
jgi:hypothetical protein